MFSNYSVNRLLCFSKVADEKFCETTIGCRDVMLAPTMRDIIQTDYFRVVVVDDEDAVEICGALKVWGDHNSDKNIKHRNV